MKTMKTRKMSTRLVKMSMRLCLSAALFMGTLQTKAQGGTMEIQGVVVDADGNPLSGATVEAAGGVVSTETDSVGMFKMEVSRWLKSVKASCPGMYSKTYKLKNFTGNKLVFRLKTNLNYNPEKLKGNMVIHGAVVDKNGNPLSGAKIEAVDLSISTVTDADGTFTMEIPRSLRKLICNYPGMAYGVYWLNGRNDKDIVFMLRRYTAYTNRPWKDLE